MTRQAQTVRSERTREALRKAALVRFLAARCTSDKVWISTNLSNTPMQKLIASEGFQMAGFVDGLDPGDPELIFSRPRAPA